MINLFRSLFPQRVLSPEQAARKSAKNKDYQKEKYTRHLKKELIKQINKQLTSFSPDKKQHWIVIRIWETKSNDAISYLGDKLVEKLIYDILEMKWFMSNFKIQMIEFAGHEISFALEYNDMYGVNW